MTEKVRLGKLEVDLNELTNFIVKAKRNGYAGGERKVREADGSKTFTFQEGNFHYTDNYAGSWQAPGQEVVRWQRPEGQQIWRMAYSGGMLSKFWGDVQLASQTYDFLKEALGLVTPALPFRGPEVYENKDFIYTMEESGDIKLFRGYEDILSKRVNDTVFGQDFIGGLVVPK